MDEMIKLQTIVEHQEQEISNLSKELYAQQRELGQLKQQVTMLIERFRSFLESAEGTQDKTPEPPPPHY